MYLKYLNPNEYISTLNHKETQRVWIVPMALTMIQKLQVKHTRSLQKVQEGWALAR